MAKVSIEWEHDVPKKAKEIVAKMIEGLWEASEEAVIVIGNESEKQVPFDIGTLRDSWDTKPIADRETIGFQMSYNTPYAARLHEHPEYKFKNGRKAKYLEQPIEENLGDWQGRFLSKLKEVTFK
jgi:hypothetical protein